MHISVFNSYPTLSPNLNPCVVSFFFVVDSFYLLRSSPCFQFFFRFKTSKTHCRSYCPFFFLCFFFLASVIVPFSFLFVILILALLELSKIGELFTARHAFWTATFLPLLFCCYAFHLAWTVIALFYDGRMYLVLLKDTSHKHKSTFSS